MDTKEILIARIEHIIQYVEDIRNAAIKLHEHISDVSEPDKADNLLSVTKAVELLKEALSNVKADKAFRPLIGLVTRCLEDIEYGHNTFSDRGYEISDYLSSIRNELYNISNVPYIAYNNFGELVDAYIEENTEQE